MLEMAKNLIDKQPDAKRAFIKAVNCQRCHHTFRDE